MGLPGFWREHLWKHEKFIDFVLLRLNALFFGMWLVVMFPTLQKIDPWWYFGLFVLTFLRPLFVILKKE